MRECVGSGGRVFVVVVVVVIAVKTVLHRGSRRERCIDGPTRFDTTASLVIAARRERRGCREYRFLHADGWRAT